MSAAGEAAFGRGDATFIAVGGEDGIRRLVDTFYDHMDAAPELATLRAMHPEDLTESRDKLARFLCGWTGGPRRYHERYGPIAIPIAHRHLPIGSAERDAWMACMARALSDQPYPPELVRYLLEQLFVPAERIRQVVASVRQPG